MNKAELLSTYTAEQLANEVIELRKRRDVLKEKVDKYENYLLPRATKKAIELIDKNLEECVMIVTCEEWVNRGKDNQSETEKYRKAFESTKKERDCQIAEYQKKIEELENRDIAELLPEEPIKVAEMLINAVKEERNQNEGLKFIRHTFPISELRQIAEHLLVYCNHNG